MDNDLRAKIAEAQRKARETAALNGTDIAWASIMAGEQAVVEHLSRQESAAREQLAHRDTNVVQLSDYRKRK